MSAFDQDEEEQSIIMGVDWTDKYVKQVLYLPSVMPWPVYKKINGYTGKFNAGGNPEIY